MLVLKGLVGLHRTIQLQLLQRYWLDGIEKDFSVSALEFKHDGEEIHVPEYLTMDEESHTVLIVNDIGEIYIFYHKVSDLSDEC